MRRPPLFARNGAPLLASALLMASACATHSAPKPPEVPVALSAPKAEAPPALVDPIAQAAAQLIASPTLRSHIETLSSDRTEGRGPGTPGGELAMQYLESQLKELGYAPAAPDGSYRQPFELLSLDSHAPATWTFTRGAKNVKLRGEEFIVGAGDQKPSTKVQNAELVFVGYGIQAPEHDWDDFKGQDLRGKVLVMLNNDPDWDPALFAGETRLYYGRWTYKYESAARQGAAGAIIIHTTKSAGYPFQVVQTSWSGAQYEAPAEGEPRLAFRAWTTEEAAASLLKLADKDLAALTEAAKQRAFTPVPLGVKTSLAFKTDVKKTASANVLGKLEGSDPALRDEVVVYTAHHDHLGIGKPDKSGDRIYNGAVDNAAGMAQVLEIARALKQLPRAPRRTSLILFVGAEEQGLLGSSYYARHPTFPVGAIAADINYDFGNVWGPTRDITYVGKEKSSLGRVVDAIAATQGRTVLPDQMPDRGFFYRSDHFSFARVGVPSVNLGEGMDMIGKPAGWGREQVERYEAEHYHQPSDEYDPSWNLDGMVEDARLGFYVGVNVANAEQLPTWTPGDEFEAARKASLAARAAAGGSAASTPAE